MSIYFFVYGLFIVFEGLILSDMSNDEVQYGNSLERGIDIIRGHVKNLPERPGVYRMLAENGDVLYVGKAKALKRRVNNYTQPNRLSVRIQRMVSQTFSMEFSYTETEVDALLLEANLIKKLKPRYNILLRDDKSFPYLLMTGDHDFPMLVKHRGARKRKGQYFGPYAHASSVNQTIIDLQRIFQLRNCTNYNFASRTRPCLQYHIKRCTAPCVGKISTDEYGQQVSEALDFLAGKTKGLQEKYADQMNAASEAMEFEKAAIFRDRIGALTAIQSQQIIHVDGLADVDVFALHREGAQSCIQVYFFRSGQNLGNKAYFPRHGDDVDAGEILSSFLVQFYQNKPVPSHVFVSDALDENNIIEQGLMAGSSEQGRVEISVPSRSDRRKVMEFVRNNAKEALEKYRQEKMSERAHMENVAKLFDLDDVPERIEVYDNSHVSGTNMVGGMIVAGPDGFMKNAYRKFNIVDSGKGDDFAMMREVMTRRFKRALKERAEGKDENWPDLLLIDGGVGQMSSVKEALEDLGVWDQLSVVGISKGPDRNAGREKFHIEGRDVFQLPVNDPTLHYLQRLRDEVHRYAIGAHRARRTADIRTSSLDDVPGIGAKRKKALLSYFGSAKAVEGASVEDLMKVGGVSKSVAQDIYDYYHDVS